MKKQEVIKKAYGKSYDALKDYINENGFVDCVKNRKISLVPFFDVTEIEFNGHLSRPKSLKGIENNNGWKLIDELNVYDNEHVLFLRMTEGGEAPIFTCIAGEDFQIGYFTHWKRVDISKPPLFDTN